MHAKTPQSDPLDCFGMSCTKATRNMTSVVFDVYLPEYNRSYLLYCVYPTIHVECIIGLHFHLRSYVTPVMYQCIVNLHQWQWSMFMSSLYSGKTRGCFAHQWVIIPDLLVCDVHNYSSPVTPKMYRYKDHCTSENVHLTKNVYALVLVSSSQVRNHNLLCTFFVHCLTPVYPSLRSLV